MTPIHDQSYQRYAGTKLPLGRAWSVIMWTGIRGMLARRAFLGLQIAAWLPFLVRSVQLYFVANYPQAAAVIPVNAQMFRDFLDLQSAFGQAIVIWAGAGLIASDRRANALQLYLSKPLVRLEYIGGKLGVLVFFLMGVIWLPAMLLILMQILLSGSFDFIRQNLFLVPAITVASFLRVFVSAFTMLALSSLSKSSRYVAVTYAGTILFTNAIFGVMRFVAGSTRVAWISISANIDQVTDAIFRRPPRYETPVIVALLVLLGLIAVSISVLERRVRGVEVVS
jgi:ABC-2 type transport system permease protein